MTSWKDTIQLGDLDKGQRLEMVCARCGHMHYLTPDRIAAEGGRLTLYLDEIEKRARCHARGCNGRVRLALARKGDTSGFVGGLA